MTGSIPKPAATVMLLRDGRQGLEVFMVLRHHQIDFAGGALVFPGGKVHGADHDPALHAHCRGLEGLSAEQAALRVAAIRETFEECGLLLAYTTDETALVAARDDRFHSYRQALRQERPALLELVRNEGLELACDQLVPFAHWITPEPVPKRFDTHFFLATAPTGQHALHDGEEAVDGVWLRPAQALAEAASGQRIIIWPTRMNLSKLARSQHVSQALDAARKSSIVTVLPQLVDGAQGKVMRIPVEADYDLYEADMREVMGNPAVRPSP